MIFLKKQHTSTLTFLFVISLFLVSCSSQPESELKKYGPEVTAVIQKDAGAFRGLNLGDKLDSVITKELTKASESDKDYLYYEYNIDSTASYNVSYNFDEAGLNEIQSEVYIHNPSNTDKVFNAFKSYFDDHFGKSVTHQGFTVWTVKSDKYGDVRINLSDESADLTVPGSPGKIGIWIYPDNE